ncbi:chromodomain-helicase-DNA-binding protein 1-like isoform X1 [Polypterus senegalus]|uniref:chromodomain-helicase-DNA-binding protein 1-like isoform X1 n=1 Tax=Polypterus senegalus TaxID=55291 RepID=UPI001963C4F1|nr:chromodomain-helicase-DNA-binding protein 1-like isoform X1 [Polypterus senegalus]
MTKFLRDVQSEIKPKKREQVFSSENLEKWGLTGIKLRPYQLEGVNWLAQCFTNQNGCILGDEMGLGKTCQTISLLVYISGKLGKNGPFLILSPLSVISNWTEELQRFAPKLSVVVYTGNKDTREKLQRDLKNHPDFNILLTTYELCLKDCHFLNSFNWKLLVVDEAHRLKNQNSLLHRRLSEFSLGFKVLLTGTPVQNNLQEIYSLLNFIEPQLFPSDREDDFVKGYKDVESQKDIAHDLHSLLQPFLLRRVKAEVAADLPKKTELVIYHGMSALQKKYYKAFLMKDLDVFDHDGGSKARLLNILIQLRKCVNHPYLFDGVEPEPFEMGEHLVEASGKLHLLDKILGFLKDCGHRVLLFSQMTRMLDILQDYMEYRDYSYERLDGSVRGEERHLAIKNFSSKDVFVFLLSTKAGGVGMNLTAADTVIFVDSDFNPQNDLQAAARAHRIGQNRPVKIIRLIGRDTVEEIVYRRATSKLKLTNTVIESGQFSLRDSSLSVLEDVQLSEILKFGVDKLLATEESTIQDADLEMILGKSEKGMWASDVSPTVPEAEGCKPEDQTHMYLYEGKDYSKDPSPQDRKAFDQLVELKRALLDATGQGGRALRNKSSILLSGDVNVQTRRKRILSPEELEERRKKRQEAAAKRAKLLNEKKLKQEEAKLKKKLAWWESCGYISTCLQSEDSEEESVDEESSDVDLSLGLELDEPDLMTIHYVMGDVTHPQASKEDAIIVHCVDDSGHWGRGGLFTALEMRSDQPRKHYELAGEMKDLRLGSVLLFPIDEKECRDTGQDQLALIVAQQRDKANNLSGIKLSALEEGLKKIAKVAKRKKASVHLPRIGHATKGFNWYGTERLIRKYLAFRKILTFIYYFSRKSNTSITPAPTPSSKSDNTDGSQQAGPSAQSLPDFMSGITVYFYNMPATERKRLARYLISYDGNEDDVLSSDITHIVAVAESALHTEELRSMVRDYPAAVVVQPKWLETCFSGQKKVSSAPYQVALS